MSKYRKIRDIRDGNAAEIVAFLRAHGIEVIETERPLDILIINGKTGFAEIKTKSRNAKIYRSQLEFMTETSMPVQFVTCEGSALIFAETMNGLTESEKLALTGLLVCNPAKKDFTPSMVETALGRKL